MASKRFLLLALLLVLPLVFAAAAAWAQGSSSEAAPLAAGTPVARPEYRTPDISELGLAAPRPVQAVGAALGLGRQRLALVVGNGTFGSRQVLASAPRDAQAVAAVLRAAGFVVMVREDLSAADLRANLKELRERLQPGGIGLIYVTALAAQVQGQNLWLPREAPLDAALAPAELAMRLGQAGVPVSEIVDALLGSPDTVRLLVLDAAFRHPALARLPNPGLAEQKLPPGMMALFSAALGTTQDLPAGPVSPSAPAAPGAAAPTDPVDMAASPFARALVVALATPRITGPDALRATRRALFDSSQGRLNPWLAGDTESRAELAEATLVDSLVPRTPEDFAREALKQASRRSGRAAGEQTVAEVLQQSAANTPAPATGTAGEATASGNGRRVPQSAAPSVPAAPAGSLASTVGSSIGTAATAVGAVAGVGALAAGVATSTAVQGVMAAQVASTVAAVAGTAVGAVGTAGSAAGSVAGNMVALATSLGSDSAATAPAAAVAPTAAAAAAAATTAAAPAAALAQPAALAAAAATSTATTTTTTAAAAAPATPSATLPATAGGAATPPSGQAPAPAPTTATPAEPATQQPVAPSSAPAAPPARNALAQAPPEWRTTRNPGGGERPVYTPRINSYGYAEGDTFTYQVRDTWKGEVTGSTTTAIEEVLGDGQLLANGALMAMDAQGRLKSLRQADGSQSTFEPAQELWWSNPKHGESRDVLFRETFQRADASRGQTEWKGSTSVGRPRKIETAAGAFEVLPIESSGWFRETLASGEQTRGRWSRTVWYSPKLGHPVAIDSEDADSAGKLLRRERVELTHAQSARGTP